MELRIGENIVEDESMVIIVNSETEIKSSL